MRPHQSRCLQVVPASNQSQRGLHLTRFRQPIRGRVSASAARGGPSRLAAGSAVARRAAAHTPECPQQSGSGGGWGCYPRRGRPLLRRRLRKISASRRDQVGVVPRAHERGVPPVLSSARRLQRVSASLARPAFRREMPPPPGSPGALALEVVRNNPDPSPGPRGVGGSSARGPAGAGRGLGWARRRAVWGAERAVGRWFGTRRGRGEAVL